MLRTLLSVTPLVALAAALSACTTAPAYPTPGGLYANEWGRELFMYRYSAAEAAHFPCGAECSSAWTPLYAGPYDIAMHEFTIMVRDDGNWQWAYHGHPIYFYAGRIAWLAQDPQMRAGLWAPLTHSGSAD